jgi:hypothetical protein
LYFLKEDIQVNKTKLLKGAALVAATSMLPLSQAAMADAGGDNWSISGWINEGMTYYDDGVGSDIIQTSDNGTTLGSRITLSGSTDLPNSGLSAGFEVILEPSSTANLLGAGSSTGFDDDENGHAIGVLGNSINLSGGFGKVTVGLQSMPTDNIAVLEDPSLTLWASISPVFRGNGATIQGLGAAATNSTWGSFLTCNFSGLGIGIDCNGVYRQGIRYDLPAFGPVTVAVGYANDDIYDIAAKYKGALGGINTSLALGYAINQGGAGGGVVTGTEAENFQLQAGAMDPGTGIFGSFAYNVESGNTAVTTASDDGDAWWLKVGIKKAFNSLGDTSIAFQYGQYSDQFGTGAAAAFNTVSVSAVTGVLTTTPTAAVANPGITGSEVERIGIEVNQYFGSRLIIYGVWENLDLDVDCSNAGCAAAYAGASDLDTFTLGGTFFF